MPFNFILLNLILIFGSLAHATSPYSQWKILESEHFEVFFDKPQKELAVKYLNAAEESYRILQPVFEDLPQKTVLVLDDSTDLTNGSATFLPYNWIQVFPTLPDPGDSLDYYSYWPKAIVIHELTHIANFQPVGGFYTPFRYIFGRIVTPNTLLPRWYLEGLAVDSESRYTLFGRLRAPRTQGMIRALSVRGGFYSFTIDQINEVEIDTWPYGERPYFFGSLLQKSLVDQGSKDLRLRWNRRYGRRLPFLIDAVPQDDFKKSYSELLGATYANLEDVAKRQMRDIQKDGKFDSKPFPMVDHEQFQPRISPDHMRLIYISKGQKKTSFWMIEKSKPEDSFRSVKPKRLFHTLYSQSFIWSPDGSGIYFDAIDALTPFVSYRRIYFYDIKTNAEKCVICDRRARSPALSPNHQWLAFISDQGGHQEVQVLDLNTNQIQTLYTGQLQERLATPTFADDENLAFVSKDPSSGVETLLSVNLSTKISTVRLQNGGANIRFPKIVDGKLAFVSNINGIDNVYLKGLDTESAAAYSNTLTWVHSFEFSESSLISAQMTDKGLRLFESPRSEFKLTKKENLIQFKDEEDQPKEETVENPYKEKNFYPFKYLIPRYIMPFLYPVEDGVIIQGSTSATDPVGVNLYSLAGSYDTVTKDSSYGLFYQNNSFPVSLDLFGLQFQEYLGASNYQVETTRVGGLLSAPIFTRRWHFGTGYSMGSSKVASTLNNTRRIKEGPEAILSYTNLGDTRYSDNGTAFSLGFEKFLDGSDRIAYERTSFSFSQKISKWLPKDHMTLFILKGAFDQGLPRSRIIEFGEASLGGNYLVNLSGSQYLFRGYPSGTFVGRQVLNTNLEYSFPLNKINKGSGTRPYFLKNLTGVIFVDTLAMDGAYFKYNERGKPSSGGAYFRTDIDKFHVSTGGEMQLDTTLAYHLPLTFILGGYYGMSEQAGDNFTLFFGIGSPDPLGLRIRGKSP